MAQNHHWDKTLYTNGEIAAVGLDGSNHEVIFGYRAKKTRGKLNTKVTREAKFGHGKIIDVLNDDPEHVLISYRRWRLAGNRYVIDKDVESDIFSMNVNNGKLQHKGKLPSLHTRAVTDHNGQVRFAIGTTANSRQSIYYKSQKTDKWVKWSARGVGNSYSILDFAEDNDSIYLVANVEEGTEALYHYNLKTDKAAKLLHDPVVDLNYPLWNFDRTKVIGAGVDLGQPSYQFFDAEAPKTKQFKRLLAAFPGNDVEITSHSQDNTKLVVFTYSDRDAGGYYLFDTKANKLKSLGAVRSGLDPKQMAVTDTIKVRTRDGVLLHGYLTRPNNTQGPLPMVVLPHGGPHGIRDHWGFNWEVQLLANQGYAVMQVNFRGSGGFGKKFEQSGYGKWGTLMQDDITDATLAMVQQGFADKNRICIFGFSYGGYAALMGAVRAPALYKCAIGAAGVYDLPMMYKQGDISSRHWGEAFLSKVLGKDQTDLKKRSPAFQAPAIKANILLIHGEQDERAPIEQAQSMINALKKADKPFEWMPLDNEAHGYYDEGNRQKVYQKILSFLKANIGD